MTVKNKSEKSKLKLPSNFLSVISLSAEMFCLGVLVALANTKTV